MTKHGQYEMSAHATRRFSWRRALIGAGVAGLALALSACGGEKKETPAANAAPHATSSTASAPGKKLLTVEDPWVKLPEEGKKMTGAFGILKNETDEDLTVVSATSPVSPKMELHEVAMVDGKMSMRAKEGGFVVPAKGTHELKPGADHIMLMDVTKPVKAGDQVVFTLTVKDKSGKTQEVQFTAVAKPFVGAKESYSPSHGETPAHHG